MPRIHKRDFFQVLSAIQINMKSLHFFPGCKVMVLGENQRSPEAVSRLLHHCLGGRVPGVGGEGWPAPWDVTNTPGLFTSCHQGRLPPLQWLKMSPDFAKYPAAGTRAPG